MFEGFTRRQVAVGDVTINCVHRRARGTPCCCCTAIRRPMPSGRAWRPCWLPATPWSVPTCGVTETRPNRGPARPLQLFLPRHGGRPGGADAHAGAHALPCGRPRPGWPRGAPHGAGLAGAGALADGARPGADPCAVPPDQQEDRLDLLAVVFPATAHALSRAPDRRRPRLLFRELPGRGRVARGWTVSTPTCWRNTGAAGATRP
jgi:hypothetical protein